LPFQPSIVGNDIGQPVLAADFIPDLEIAMAKRKTASHRHPGLGDDSPGLRDAMRDNYLGDPTVVNKVLREAVRDILIQPGDPTEAEHAAAIARIIGEAAAILLGRNDAYVPMQRWNEEGRRRIDGSPGGISGAARDWLGGFEGSDMAAMQTFVAVLYSRALARFRTADGGIRLDPDNADGVAAMNREFNEAVAVLLAIPPGLLTLA
jgi:hypothetical protein